MDVEVQVKVIDDGEDVVCSRILKDIPRSDKNIRYLVKFFEKSLRDEGFDDA